MPAWPHAFFYGRRSFRGLPSDGVAVCMPCLRIRGYAPGASARDRAAARVPLILTTSNRAFREYLFSQVHKSIQSEEVLNDLRRRQNKSLWFCLQRGTEGKAREAGTSGYYLRYSSPFSNMTGNTFQSAHGPRKGLFPTQRTKSF